MDMVKIGSFLQELRQEHGLTQAELGDKLGVTNKTISRWETGNYMPPVEMLEMLSNLYGLTINELLSGQKLTTEEYKEMAEDKLLELQKTKEYGDKALLFCEIVIVFLSTLILFSSIFVSFFFSISLWLRILIISAGVIVFLLPLFFAIRIEQKVGLYECKKCHSKYTPTYNQVFRSMHLGRTRFMKCPHCKKYSWQKKIIK